MINIKNEESTESAIDETSKKKTILDKAKKNMYISRSSNIFLYVQIIFIFTICYAFIKKVSTGEIAVMQIDLVSIIVTAGISIASGAFVLFQYNTLKNRGKIRSRCLFHSIAETLQNDIRNLEFVVKHIDANGQYIATIKGNIIIMASEYRIGEKTWTDIDELEKLLYEHGRRGNSDYTKKTIEVISLMKSTAHKINISCNVLEDDVSSDEIIYLSNELDELKCELKDKTEKYISDYFKQKYD